MELRDYQATKLSEVPRKFHKELKKELLDVDPVRWIHVTVTFEDRGWKRGPGGPSLWFTISTMKDEKAVINYYNSGGMWKYVSLEEFLAG